MTRSLTLRAAAVLLTALAAAPACLSPAPPPPSYDLVVANGRVMDPESGLDAVRHLGIRSGRVETVSETPLAGTRVIDASQQVVAPGFIDLHEHGQQEESYAMMVRDGVTSALELEVGAADIDAWYAARAAGQLVNHGVSVGHIPARMKVLGDPGTGLLPAGIGGSGRAPMRNSWRRSRRSCAMASPRARRDRRVFVGDSRGSRGRPGRDDRGVSVRRRHDRNPVGAVR